MLKILKKKPLWLVVFVGGDERHGSDERAVKTYTERVAHIINTPPPRYEVMRIPRAQVRSFPVGVTVKHELSERFSNVILNPLISTKRDIGATEAALVIFGNAFPNIEVYEATLRESQHDSSIFHLVCSWTDFLGGIDNRLSCYHQCCSACKKMGSSCKHSCLPRLLWLMFNKDDNVLQALRA